MEAIKHDKKLKQLAEMDKLRKLNQGAAAFMKNERKQLEKGQNLKVAKLEING